MLLYKDIVKNKKRIELKESLRMNDLKYLISPIISIDQYTSKINKDNITIALYCSDKNAANDLKDFLEKMYVIEIKDIEVSDNVTKHNNYIIFVEFDRNYNFSSLMMDIKESLKFLCDEEKWYFVSFKHKNKELLTKENIVKNIRLSKLDIKNNSSENAENKESKESENIKNESKINNKKLVEYKLNNIKRKYYDMGIISNEQFSKEIENSCILENLSLDKDVLEYNYPTSTIIICEDCAYILDNDIRKLIFL